MTRTSFARARALTATVATLAVAAPAAVSGAVPGAPASANAIVGDCTPGSDWGTPREDLTARVVDLVNQHRASRGLVQLTGLPTLSSAASWKSRHMAKYLYMTHNDPAPPVARTTSDRFLACGYPTGSAGWGENIAYGYTTADAVLQAWLDSAGHRANIENASFRSIGVSAVASSTGTLYWTQTFGTLVGSGTPPPPPPPSYACSNGWDDDGDGKTDYPADPGCTSSSDTDESNTPVPPPAPSARTAVPSSVSVNRGSVRGGNVTSLGADDSSYLQVGATGSSFVWQARIAGVPNTLANLRVVYRSLSSPTCTQTISIWNWQRRSWTSLDSRSLGTSELEISVAPTGTLADYVSGSAGNGDVDIRVRCNGTSSGFVGSADLLAVSYTA